ncbi:MAG: FkbM family methyltransferase [Pseudomonadota bacterium]
MLSRRYLRALVVRAPQLQDVKFAAQAAYRKITKTPFEPEFEVLRALSLAQGECIVDVGANRGQSIDAIRLYLKTAPIHAFEANAALAAALTRRLSGQANLQIHPCGLADNERSETLFIPYYGEYMFDGLASIDRDEAAGWLNAKALVGFDERRLRIEETAVSLRTFDAFNLSPAFMKLDVQGAERAVLAGAEQTLRRSKPVLLIETGRDEALVAAVQAAGYEAFNYVSGRLSPRRNAVRNTVFAHPSAPRGLERLMK